MLDFEGSGTTNRDEIEKYGNKIQKAVGGRALGDMELANAMFIWTTGIKVKTTHGLVPLNISSEIDDIHSQVEIISFLQWMLNIREKFKAMSKILCVRENADKKLSDFIPKAFLKVPEKEGGGRPNLDMPDITCGQFAKRLLGHAKMFNEGYKYFRNPTRESLNKINAYLAGGPSS